MENFGKLVRFAHFKLTVQESKMQFYLHLCLWILFVKLVQKEKKAVEFLIISIGSLKENKSMEILYIFVKVVSKWSMWPAVKIRIYDDIWSQNIQTCTRIICSIINRKEAWKHKLKIGWNICRLLFSIFILFQNYLFSKSVLHFKISSIVNNT